MQALEDLDYLAALDNDGNLSEFGIIMSEFPLDPQLSKSLLASCEFECVDEMLTIAAMVTGTPAQLSLQAWCHLPNPDPSTSIHKSKFLLFSSCLLQGNKYIWLCRF